MKKGYLLKLYRGGFFSICILIVTAGFASCQNNSKQPQNQKQQASTIPAEQEATIKKILSGFNASKLNAADAKAIHEKFRQAGIHAGPETNDAIRAAGFDPEILRTLDPPPSGNDKNRNAPPSPEERMKSIESTIIKPLSLSPTQQEAVAKAFREFLSEMESMKKTQKNPQEPLEKAKVEPLEKKRDAKIKQVLTEDQFIKYQELERNSRPHQENQKSPGQK